MTTINFDNLSSKKVISPTKFAHVVLRTNNIKGMIEFYTTFLGAHVVFENEMLAFITYDDEHHRIALIGIPTLQPKDKNTNGLEHIAFSFDTIYDLLLSYRQRRERGILPVWNVNHGPTTSIYYRDPDGNMLETQVDNYDTPEEATAFMKTKNFQENPLGVDFDPEEYIARLKGGESEEVFKTRVEIGPRGIESVLAVL